MHPFSIDYITREKSDYPQYDYCLRETPSPGDSGVDCSNVSNSPQTCESPNDQTTKSVARALLTLDKTAKAVSPSDDEKPPHSYIALISMAILSDKYRKMLLCDIYQYIMDTFSYYNNKEKAWRNSIRHNLSLNECFIKNGRADNGKGNYWSIHPACEEDFSKGDFRRRQARRRARKSTKEPSTSDSAMQYRCSVGYVPMTSSHIGGYHPYSSAPLSYPQVSYPCGSQSDSQSPSLSPAYSNSAMPLQFCYPQTSLSSQAGYFSGTPAPAHQSISPSMMYPDQVSQYLSAAALNNTGFQYQSW